MVIARIEVEVTKRRTDQTNRTRTTRLIQNWHTIAGIDLGGIEGG